MTMTQESRWPNKYLLFISLLTSLGGSFHFGYQQVIVNPAQSAFMHFVNESFTRHYKSNLICDIEAIWSAIVAILYIGAIFGSFSIRPIADRFGRKNGLLLSYFLSLISVSISIVSYFITSWELYTISRITLGYAIGLNLGLSGLYLAESSPKQCRGFTSSMTGVFVGAGVLIGSVVALPQLLGTTNHWWIVYLIAAIIYALVLTIFSFSHETPAYLLKSGKQTEAEKAIKFFYNCEQKEIEGLVSEINNNFKQKQAQSTGMMEVWKDPISRKGTFVGCVSAFGTCFCGMTVNNAYSVEIIQSIGLSETKASLANLGLNTVLLLAIIGSSFVSDKYGRRPIILVTYFGLLCANIGIFVLMLLYSIYKITWIGVLLVICIGIFLVFFAFGPGPLVYFLTAELVPQDYGSAAQSWAMLVQMISRTALLAGYLPLKNGIGQAWAELALFVVPMLIAWLIFYFMLPETKNRNFNEVKRAMENELPSMKKFFKKRTDKYAKIIIRNEPTKKIIRF